MDAFLQFCRDHYAVAYMVTFTVVYLGLRAAVRRKAVRMRSKNHDQAA